MNILIAEDEPQILRPYKIVLESRGHKVTATMDGQSCINIYEDMLKTSSDFKKNKKSSMEPPFDVVVLDYRMPKIDGLEVAKQILVMCPKQRIIFASAYVKQTLEESLRYLNQVVELLQKPFDPDVLADAIEDQQAYDGLKSLVKGIGRFDTSNPSKDQMKLLFDGLRKIQKNRTY